MICLCKIFIDSKQGSALWYSAVGLSLGFLLVYSSAEDLPSISLLAGHWCQSLGILFIRCYYFPVTLFVYPWPQVTELFVPDIVSLVYYLWYPIMVTSVYVVMEDIRLMLYIFSNVVLPHTIFYYFQIQCYYYLFFIYSVLFFVVA